MCLVRKEVRLTINQKSCQTILRSGVFRGEPTGSPEGERRQYKSNSEVLSWGELPLIKLKGVYYSKGKLETLLWERQIQNRGHYQRKNGLKKSHSAAGAFTNTGWKAFRKRRQRLPKKEKRSVRTTNIFELTAVTEVNLNPGKGKKSPPGFPVPRR